MKSLIRIIGVGALAFACAGASSSAQSAPRKGTSDPAVAWLPAETQLVLRVRYSDIRGSELFRRLMSTRPMFSEELAHLDHVAAFGGLDLAKDFDTAVVGTDGKSRGQSVAVLTGRFDAKTLGARLAAKGATKGADPGAAQGGDAGAATFYTLPSAPGVRGRKSTSPETVVAFPETATMLVGTKPWVQAALIRGRSRGAVGATSTPALGALLGKVDDGASLWTVAGSKAVAGKFREEMEGHDVDASAFEGIRDVVASFRITNEVKLDSEATATSEDDADMLAMTIRGLIAVAGLKSILSDPELADALKELQVDRTARGVRLSGRIPASIAKRL